MPTRGETAGQPMMTLVPPPVSPRAADDADDDDDHHHVHSASRPHDHDGDKTDDRHHHHDDDHNSMRCRSRRPGPMGGDMNRRLAVSEPPPGWPADRTSPKYFCCRTSDNGAGPQAG